MSDKLPSSNISNDILPKEMHNSDQKVAGPIQPQNIKVGKFEMSPSRITEDNTTIADEKDKQAHKSKSDGSAEEAKLV